MPQKEISREARHYSAVRMLCLELNSKVDRLFEEVGFSRLLMGLPNRAAVAFDLLLMMVAFLLSTVTPGTGWSAFLQPHPDM
ncbi:hypothetical protein BDZ45DRAFT_674570 [Acephala macrosclerotiorum]|nr:hypothetical protein BDZ45DRAFT_674570 [Acephala macrosclerotiorum]